jgi:putative PIN family toxin of toxin-antitoxin system
VEDIREKLIHKLKVPEPVVEEFIKSLAATAEIIEPAPVPPTICRDPDDVMLLGLAESGRADVIVTGDKDLLILKRHAAARILTPREFWELDKLAKE